MNNLKKIISIITLFLIPTQVSSEDLKVEIGEFYDLSKKTGWKIDSVMDIKNKCSLFQNTNILCKKYKPGKRTTIFAYSKNNEEYIADLIFYKSEKKVPEPLKVEKLKEVSEVKVPEYIKKEKIIKEISNFSELKRKYEVELENLKSKEEEGQKKIEKLNQENESIKKDNSKVQKRINDLKAVKIELEEDMSKKEKEILKMKVQLKNKELLEKEVSTLTLSKEKALLEITNLKKDLDFVKKSMKKELDTLKQRLDYKIVENLKIENLQFKTKMNKLKSTLHSLNKENKATKKSHIRLLNQQERLKEENDKREKLIKELEVQLTSKKEELEKKRVDILNNEIVTDGTKKALTSAMESNNDLINEIDGLKKNIEIEQFKRDRLTRELKESYKMKEEVSDLKNELSKNLNLNKKLNLKLEDILNKNSKINKEIEVINDSLIDSSDSIEKLSMTNKEYFNKLEKLKEKYSLLDILNKDISKNYEKALLRLKLKSKELTMKIRNFKKSDFTSVKSIYQQGIDTGNATFQKKAKGWNEWNSSFLRLMSFKNLAIT